MTENVDPGLAPGRQAGSGCGKSSSAAAAEEGIDDAGREMMLPGLALRPSPGHRTIRAVAVERAPRDDQPPAAGSGTMIHSWFSTIHAGTGRPSASRDGS